MARINTDLLARIQQKLGIKRARAYQLIDAKVRASHLPRPLAAIAVASENGINISKYASEDELATMRQSARASAPPPVVVPALPTASARKAGPSGSARKNRAQARRGTSVFVVHGRNESARDALFQFLRTIGLHPIEWTQAIKKTGQASPYVGTILSTAFREAAAVIVLLTADDEARLLPKFRKTHDPDYERKLVGQARPNVLFEAGMAFGHNPESTVIVQLGEVKPFSDVAGRHIVRLSNTSNSRQELCVKLANAGCNVDTTGTDWLSAGSF